MAGLLGQPFSFIAEAAGTTLGAIIATQLPAAPPPEGSSQPGSPQAAAGLCSARLECVAVDPELDEKAEILACLLHFFLQYLQALPPVGSLLEGMV